MTTAIVHQVGKADGRTGIVTEIDTPRVDQSYRIHYHKVGKDGRLLPGRSNESIAVDGTLYESWLRYRSTVSADPANHASEPEARAFVAGYLRSKTDQGVPMAANAKEAFEQGRWTTSKMVREALVAALEEALVDPTTIVPRDVNATAIGETIRSVMKAVSPAQYTTEALLAILASRVRHTDQTEARLRDDLKAAAQLTDEATVALRAAQDEARELRSKAEKYDQLKALIQ